MVGLEVVVRPLIFPDIRPRPRPALPPQDDPTKGFAVIAGNPTVSTSNSFSFSISSSHSKPVETERRVDEARVYQQEDDGTINRDNFIDIEVANRITMREPDTSGAGFGTPGVGSEMAVDERMYYYERLEEAENKEIKERDKIKKPSGLEQAR